jgi:hypothetical protein
MDNVIASRLNAVDRLPAFHFLTARRAQAAVQFPQRRWRVLLVQQDWRGVGARRAHLSDHVDVQASRSGPAT